MRLDELTQETQAQLSCNKIAMLSHLRLAVNCEITSLYFFLHSNVTPVDWSIINSTTSQPWAVVSAPLDTAQTSLRVSECEHQTMYSFVLVHYSM